MLFSAFAQSVSDFFSAVLPTAAVPAIFVVAFFDQEAGSILSAVFARSPAVTGSALILTALAAGLVRSIVLYELALHGAAHLGDDPQFIRRKYQSSLRSRPFFWITGLQCCFAFRWTLPVLCAKFGIRRTCFYAASLLGVAFWTGALYSAAHVWLQLCYPGLLGQAEAARVIPGLTIIAFVAVVTVKAAVRRWAERLQTKKNQH